MAKWREPSEQDEREYQEWVESRPDMVRDIARKLSPWELYRMKSTGQLVTLYSVSEDMTVTVTVSPEFNTVLFGRNVFGVSPDDLESAELPLAPGFAAMSPEQVDDNIDQLRVMIRPDLWEMSEDGKAVLISDKP